MSDTSVSSPFQLFAQTHRPAIDQALSDYTTYSPDCPGDLAEAIRYSLLAPGKRLRPLLVLMSADACGCTTSEAIPAACAVEMVHAYSLIHDDLPAMDDDDMRRGRPSCHAKFGEATAILAGDALLAQAFETLASGLARADVAAKCCAILGKSAGPTQLVGGQAADLSFERAQTSGDEELLRAIHRRKTGALFLAALRMGAAIAEATNEQIGSLDTYGKSLGLAFQITDDLLDCNGAEESMGKRVGKDQEKGKLTFPGLLGIDESRRQGQQLIQTAIAALDVFRDKASRLESLAHFVLERNR
jgi:geranylgeranyl diphosphate synthase type II